MSLRRNIELKARCADLVSARTAAEKVGARRTGMLVQTDTYFRVANGRLKLREIEGAQAELIWYARLDSVEFRASDYIVTRIVDPASALAALTQAQGVRGIVRNRRELLMLENVRIHLDEVEGLGKFVEFEAVITESSQEAAAQQQLKELCDTLKIAESDRVAHSYSDLLGL